MTREQEAGKPLTKAGHRLVAWLHDDEWKILKKRAYDESVSVATLVRRALRSYLGIED